VGADASRALAPHGELAVDGAVSTHRQDDPDKLNHSHLRALTDLRNQDHSGLWLFRWFTKTPEGSDYLAEAPAANRRWCSEP